MSTDSLTHQDIETCKNCRATTQGKYCQNCGQATHLHVPSAREFLHEFIAHYVALEGKLWKSLGTLLFRPGLLTKEYIDGRRVRYIEPLRLYLTFSIIFFALFKFSGMELINLGDEKPAAIVAAADHKPAAESDAEPDAEPAAKPDPKPMVADTPEHTAELKRSVNPIVSRVTSVNATMGQKFEHFFDLPRRSQEEAFKRAFYSYAPYVIFALMPVFAFYLKVLYLGTGRRYGEHFLFALHSNAFAFLMFGILLLLPNWDMLEFIVVMWLLFYLPTAMRRVYGGSRRMTALRWIVLMAMHLLSMTLAISLAMVMAIFS